MIIWGTALVMPLPHVPPLGAALNHHSQENAKSAHRNFDHDSMDSERLCSHHGRIQDTPHQLTQYCASEYADHIY